MVSKAILLQRQLFFLLAVFCSISLFSQTTINVTSCNLNGWVKNTPGSSTISFVNGPSATPLGKGSLQFNAPTPVFVRVRNINYSGVLLSTLTDLAYSSFVQQAASNLEVPFIVLQVDNDMNGTADKTLAFNPRWQTGTFIIGPQLPDQGVIKKDIWQTWDALNGGWWTGPDPNPDNGGIMYKLSSYVNQYPNARIMNDAGGGGIRLNGSASTIFSNNFIGNVDAFTIGVSGNSTTYNFEKSIGNAGEDKSVIYGYGTNCTTLNGNGSGGVAAYSYTWLGANNVSNDQNLQVCPTTTTTYALTVTDLNGCTGSDEITVFVKDVRCGNKMDKVMICHNGKETCVSGNAVQSHLNHGDQLGVCPSFGSESNSNNGVTARVEFRAELLEKDEFKMTNYPNPVVGSTTIHYTLPFDCNVSLKVSDVSGREVSRLVSGNKKAGSYSTSFNGNSLSQGIYYYKMIATSGAKTFTKTNKMAIVH